MKRILFIRQWVLNHCDCAAHKYDHHECREQKNCDCPLKEI